MSECPKKYDDDNNLNCGECVHYRFEPGPEDNSEYCALGSSDICDGDCEKFLPHCPACKLIAEQKADIAKINDSLEWYKDAYQTAQKNYDVLYSERFKAFGSEEYWIYMPNDENYLESLVCPAVVSADQLREFHAQKAEIAELKETIATEKRLKQYHRKRSEKRCGEIAELKAKLGPLEKMREHMVNDHNRIQVVRGDGLIGLGTDGVWKTSILKKYLDTWAKESAKVKRMGTERNNEGEENRT